jgi:uncharacterized protein YheU (UPF0270 family)
LAQWPDEDERPPPVPVPHSDLSPEALQGVIEAFVLREGTEYGAHDVPLEHKVAQVLRQLERGEARILFDPVTESIDVIVVPQRERR